MAADQSPVWVVFFGGLGLGSLVTSAITAWLQYLLSKKSKVDERRFAERKDAFSTMLLAISRLDRDGPNTIPETENNLALSVARCQLVASQKVRDLLVKWREEEPGSDERVNKVAALIEEMPSDLGVTN